MLWSQRSVVLVAAVSAVIFSALISARSSYDGKLEKYQSFSYTVTLHISLC